MALEANKALYQRYFAILLAKTPDKLDEVLSLDFIGHDLPPGLPPGPEALKRFRRMVDTAMPDQEGTMEDLIAEGDTVVGRWTLRGTHTGGPFLGVPPSGKRLTIRLIEIVRIGGDKIVERWVLRDRLGELQQLGALPANPAWAGGAWE
jgi:predicted ester cyclase